MRTPIMLALTTALAFSTPSMGADKTFAAGRFAMGIAGEFAGGNFDGDEELNGSLTLLGPNLKEELATIGLSHIIIKDLVEPSTEANSADLYYFTAKLSAEVEFFSVYNK